MTVGKRLQTTLISAMGLQSDLLQQGANNSDPAVQQVFRDCAREIAEVAAHLRSRLRQLVVEEPQYSSVEQSIDLWEDEYSERRRI